MHENGGFIHLAELVRRRAGIELAPEKAHAIVRRLAPVANIFGFKDSEMLLAELAHPREELAQAVTEAITTQDTSFFREPAVFEYFEQIVLPALTLARAQKKRLRIWSAGCATGQEAYSLAMLLEDADLHARSWNVDLLATDFSADAISRAKEGMYSDYEIQRGLSPAMRSRHFVRESDGWRATQRLRRAVTFRPFNLLDHFGWLGDIDVIFCRNVMIYLTREEKSALLEKIDRTLSADGWLILGSAEGGSPETLPFEPVPGPRGIFRKRQKTFI
jgi:chemotaxis protein methyltransferase CheR